MTSKVGYGAVYLDRGEGMTDIKNELEGLLGSVEVGCLFYDVIGGPRQRGLIDEYVERVDSLARSLLPAGTPVAVKGSIAATKSDDGPRPMRAAAIESIEAGAKAKGAIPLAIEHVVQFDLERVGRSCLAIAAHGEGLGEKQAMDVILVGVPHRLGDEVREAITDALGNMYDTSWLPMPTIEALPGETLSDPGSGLKVTNEEGNNDA